MTLAEPLTILAQPQRWDGRMMGDWGWMWGFGLLSMVLLVVLIVGVVLAATRGSRPTPHDPTSRAREILNERYARGEISTEEYRERLDALG